jgi:hypothetical protein
LELTTWKDWTARNPNTTVLSTETGHRRDYTRNPYADYFRRAGLMFPVKPVSDKLPEKSRVLGVWTEKSARAYPESAFGKRASRVADQIDGLKVIVEYDPASQSLRIIEADKGIQWMYSFWFAWHAFRPHTSIHAP